MPRGSAYPGSLEDLDAYRDLVDRHAEAEVLGAKNPYTSRNGWMTSFLDPTGADVDIAHYISRQWHEREVERLWRRVWQFACRENDIPEVGDHVLYEIANDSYIMMRSAPDEIKAYPNACLHRGRRLKDHAGRCSELRCSFHGFAWALDGGLKDVPARWDFDHVKDEEFSLPECQVGTWAGFVMINPDPDAGPLESFLGSIVDQFEEWDLGNRYTQAHVAKVIHANWKVAQEAFCEAYHVNATHPQILPYLGDTNSQIDIWENFARVITPGGTPSPLLDWTPTQDEMMRAMTDTRHDEPTPMPVAEDESMRAVGAEARSAHRRTLRTRRRGHPAGHRRRPLGTLPARRILDRGRAPRVRPAALRLGGRAADPPPPHRRGPHPRMTVSRRIGRHDGASTDA